jgi:class 3 adenylate cyclase
MGRNREYNHVSVPVQTEKTQSRELLRDPMVLQAMQLATRLRDAKGDSLESEDYFAISEATGVSEEVLRFVEVQGSGLEKRNIVDGIRSQFFSLDSETRRFVSSAALGTFTALLWKLGDKIDAFTSSPALVNSQYGLFQSVAYLLMVAAIYNAAISKSIRSALVTGGIFGGSAFLMGTLFGMLFLIRGMSVSPGFILVWIAGGAAIGNIAHLTMQRFKGSVRKPKDQSQRQALLKQLVDLQDQLREGEQSVSFLSLDVVGSTKMKFEADPLAVEFTFNEYHHFVEKIVEKHFGRIHSTAGDGITAAFEHPQNAFNAARQIQTGLIELNTLRNKIGIPLQLRAGIHSGEVLTPKAGDVTSVNFASVIDIAAHLQKECPIGGIAISDAAATSITGGSASVGTERIQVHETQATIWQRKRAIDTFQLQSNPN